MTFINNFFNYVRGALHEAHGLGRQKTKQKCEEARIFQLLQKMSKLFSRFFTNAIQNHDANAIPSKIVPTNIGLRLQSRPCCTA